MKKNLLTFVLLTVVFSMSGFSAYARQYQSWFFFARKELAVRKIIPAGELTVCLFGNKFAPPNRQYFKGEIQSSNDTQARLLERKTCDVALIHNDSVEQEKQMEEIFVGFAIYKISGTNLELYIYPKEIGWIAVANNKFASQQILLKKDIDACGKSPLRNLFRPNPNIWKDWSDWNSPLADLKKEDNPIDNGVCDVMILKPEDYKIYIKRVGTTHPTFDVSPDKDEMTRRK